MDRVDYQSVVVQDLINFERSKELNLSPWYQRRSVWTPPQKSYLINTIFEHKPIPAIYIRHTIDLEQEKSVKEIVDGQQRVRTILEYYSNNFDARHPSYDTKVRFNNLSPTEKQSFLISALPVGYLLGATDSDVIDIFGRINSVSKTLNTQEKRNAKYSGELKQFALQESAYRIQLWRNLNIFTANDIARMNEVQFISDLIYNLEYGLSDFSQKLLDNYYEDNEEHFASREAIALRIERIFRLVGTIDPTLIRDTVFRRQPIFFSFLIALDALLTEHGEVVQIEQKINDIDAIFNTPEAQSDADQEFVAASVSTTQRLSRRQVRHDYLLRHFG